MDRNGPGGQHRDEMGSNTNLLRTIDTLMQCSLLMNEDLSLECVLRQIMNEAKSLVGAEIASVFLVDGPRQELYSNVNSTNIEIRIPVNVGIAGHVAITGESVVIQDTYGDERFAKVVDTNTGFTTRNMMCVPLRFKKGDIMGVVQLINKTGVSSDGGFTQDDLHFLQVFASQASTAIQNTHNFDDAALTQPSSEQSPTGAEHSGNDISNSLAEDEDELGLIKEHNQFCGGSPTESDGSDATSSYSSMRCSEGGQSAIEGGCHQHGGCPSGSDSAAPKTCTTEAIELNALKSLNAYVLDWLAVVDEMALDKNQLASFLLKIEQARSVSDGVNVCTTQAMKLNEAVPSSQSAGISFDVGVASFDCVASFCVSLVYDLLLSMASGAARDGHRRTTAWTDITQTDEDYDDMSRRSSLSSEMSKRKSGRSRQRAAKWWSTVRCRTPSPGRVLTAVAA
jgi:putative methionine-R-sulfoxide reductase with GAF domain